MSEQLATLVHKEQLAPTIINLLLKPLEPVHYHAGQYIMLGFNPDDLKPFSIAAAPREDGLLECHIRDHDGDEWMKTLFATEEGQQLVFEGPKSQMHRVENQRPAIFVAGGTGFAPMKAILEDLINHQATMPIYFYWGARKKEDLYLHQTMQQLSEKHANIHYIPVLSEEADDWDGATGLVHQKVLQDHPDLTDFQVYLCGPWPMQQTAKEDFSAAGLDLENLVC